MKQLLKDKVFSSYFKYRSFKADRNHQTSAMPLHRRDGGPDHILIIVIDALRPDLIPRFSGFETGHAISPATWTFPAVTSIHSGQYPHEHGAVVHTHPDDDEFARPEQANPDTTLPEVAEAAGYETYGAFAFPQPFIAVEGWYQSHRVYQDVDAETLTNGYRRWKGTREKTFAYLHLSDLHIPVTPPDRYLAERDVDTSIENLKGFGHQYVDSFDPDDPDAQRFRDHRLRLSQAAFDYVSDCLDELLADMGDSSLVVITGDHGEALYEHAIVDEQFSDSRPNYGVGHGGTPFDAVARVPVAVSDSRLKPTGGRASLIDLPATISQEITPNSPFNGQLWQDPIPDERIVICEASRYGAERKAAYLQRRKIIKSETDGVTLTAVVNENGERFTDIPANIEEQLTAALPEYWDDFDSRESASKIVEDQLKALGYK